MNLRTTSNLVHGLSVRLMSMLAMAGCIFGCQSPQKHSSLEHASAPPPVVLASGDVVRVVFPGAPELNLTQKIRPDGKLGLPLIGEVDAAGESLPGLQGALSRRYKTKLQNSTVVVDLETSAAVVYVSGAVNKPGKVSLERPMTAFEAIMEAGGFMQGLANPKKVILVRKDGGQHQTQVLDLSPTFRNERASAIYLRPYDVLLISERMF